MEKGKNIALEAVKYHVLEWYFGYQTFRTGQEEVVSSGPDHEDPSWAPDGRHIICSRKDGASSSLCILDTKDKSEVKLPLRPGIWRAPDWSRPMP